MQASDKQKLTALRDRLVVAQTEHLLRAADGPGLPSANEVRKIADIEGAIGAVEALLDGHK